MWRWLGACSISLWCCYSIWNLVKLTDPPACRIGKEICATPRIEQGASYLLHVFATQGIPPRFMFNAKSTLKLPGIGAIPGPLDPRNPSQLPAKTARWIATLEASYGDETSCDVSQKHLRAFSKDGEVREDPQPSWFQRKFRGAGCSRSIYWEVPQEWRHNASSIYFSALATDSVKTQEVVFGQTVHSVSIHRPKDFKPGASSKHFLLEPPALSDPDGDVLEQIPPHVPQAAVPKLVKLGPTLLQGAMGESQLARPRLGMFVHVQDHQYIPPLSLDTLASPRDEYQFLADPESAENVPIVRIALESVSWRKASIQRLMMGSIETLEKTMGTSQYDSDSLKLLIAGESPITLLLTFIVSFLHLIFEFLALSSSVIHFRGIAGDAVSSEKTSKRSVLLDLVFEGAVLLWLRDEGEAKLVQIVLALKIVYNIWRYWVLVRSHAQSNPTRRRNKETETVKQFPLWQFWNVLTPAYLKQMREKMTVDDFERMTLVALAWLAVPVAAGLAAYQLVYVPQKSWHSWAIKSAAMSGYVGGFVAMTPQLFRNFYFQSVEHLPWATLTYQFLNTIIDDLFSFLIRMPKEHRMSVFRDDIIFVIYWFQKRHYRNNPQPHSGATETSPVAETELIHENEESSGQSSDHELETIKRRKASDGGAQSLRRRRRRRKSSREEGSEEDSVEIVGQESPGQTGETPRIVAGSTQRDDAKKWQLC